jgi:hypothetical protein
MTADQFARLKAGDRIRVKGREAVVVALEPDIHTDAESLVWRHEIEYRTLRGNVSHWANAGTVALEEPQ